jgi:hypothetical protein
MAFGFPAYFSEDRTYQYPQHQLVMVVKSTLESLGWQYRELPNYVFEASISINLASWGEKFRVEVYPNGTLKAQSKCAYPLQCIDWGKNNQNVKMFFSRLEWTIKSELDYYKV